jgi:hypothetical protein
MRTTNSGLVRNRKRAAAGLALYFAKHTLSPQKFFKNKNGKNRKRCCHTIRSVVLYQYKQKPLYVVALFGEV